MHSQVLEGHEAPRKNLGKERSIEENHSKMRTSGAKTTGSQIRGKNARRNPKTGAVRSQRRLGTGKGCLQTQQGHSDVKTCRVAETRARQHPQVMPKEIATVSRIEDYPGDSNQSYDVHEKKRRSAPSSDHRRREGIWRNWDSWLPGFSNIRDDRRCISTIP